MVHRIVCREYVGDLGLELLTAPNVGRYQIAVYFFCDEISEFIHQFGNQVS